MVHPTHGVAVELMKPLIAILIFVPLLVYGQGANLRDPGYLASLTVASSAACSTVEQALVGTATGGVTVGAASTSKYMGWKITATNNFTTCRIGIVSTNIGSPTFNVSVEIWNYDPLQDQPTNDVIHATSAGIAASSLIAGTNYWDFTVPAALTASTDYSVVLIAETIGDASNHIVTQVITESGFTVKRDSDGTDTWTLAGSNRRGQSILLK